MLANEGALPKLSVIPASFAAQDEIITWLPQVVLAAPERFFGGQKIPDGLRPAAEQALGLLWPSYFGREFRTAYTGVQGDADSLERAALFRLALEQAAPGTNRRNVVFERLGFQNEDMFLRRNTTHIRLCLEFALAEAQARQVAQEAFHRNVDVDHAA